MPADSQLFTSIVVGTDGSETADKAVQRAIELAKSLSASLRIVTAFQPKPISQDELDREATKLPAEMSWMLNPPEVADRILDIAAGKAREQGLEVETYARQGDPADALLDVAEERDADLIIVGNKGMTGAKRFLLGSVPNKVSHHAPCSVLIIRTI